MKIMKNYKVYIAILSIAACLLIQTGCNGEGGVGASPQKNAEASSQDDAIEEKMNIYTYEPENMPFFKSFNYKSYAGIDAIGGRIELTTDGDLAMTDFYGMIPLIDRDGNIIEYDISIPLTIDQYEELIHIVKTYDLWSWDGFIADSNIIYVDGGGFKLEIEWLDGSSTLAYNRDGSSVYPERFHEADQEMEEFFKQFKTLVIRQAPPEAF